MFSFASIYYNIANARSGKAMKNAIKWMRLQAPADVTGMLHRGEPPAYIAAACLAVSQIGA